MIRRIDIPRPEPVGPAAADGPSPIGLALDAGRSAADHARTLTRARVLRVASDARRTLVRLALIAVAGFIAVVTLAIGAGWSLVTLLSGVAGLFDSPMIGGLVAVGGFLGAIVLGVLSLRFALVRRRVRSARRSMSDADYGDDDPDTPEDRVFDAAEQRALAGLRADRRKAQEAVRTLLRDHPIATTASGFAGGFLGTRLLTSARRRGGLPRRLLALARLAGMSLLSSELTSSDDGSRASDGETADAGAETASPSRV